VTLCERHASRLGSTSPSDLLFMMLAATPPSPRVRNRIYNPYRLRRIINRNRSNPISFGDLYHALEPIESAVKTLGRWPTKNYKKMRERIARTLQKIPDLESKFLSQVKDFYREELGRRYANQILGLDIEDCYRHPRRPTRYRVAVRISGTNKGRFIGRGGAIVQKLESRFDLSVDIQ
jgi:transposase-like protein